ncbi:hypothetical protein [Hymenobacter edaphi]|uniref:Lipoprotein n=1 Tax=Hymenobacter edaphi TaxID=2211146 RepID=A0A328BSN9_9BACT|nr:hypothetical protein [Hymenobacter edaphi]RAK70063.1 hypothetical protein DLM85_04210 [Hymenobacter edaphi]
MKRLLFPVAAGLLLGLGACKNTSEAPTASGRDYYPLKVGTERVYDVVDRSYTNNRATETRSQVREQLTESYTDATGALTYKLVRSSRALATDGWRVDSVQTLTVNAQNLLLTRSNWRTVELIFPVRDGAEWNKNAFNDRDTLVALNRRYQDVGASFAAGTRSYDNTLTTYDDDPDRNNLYYEFNSRQVFAKGIGPVLRESRALNYCQPNGSSGCQVGVNYITSGKTHTETLVQ